MILRYVFCFGIQRLVKSEFTHGLNFIPKLTNDFCSNVKRMMIASNLISRVIGRGGCNINAIREITAAHIDIDKLKKGAIERTVTIK